jgi:glycosyltransferase involved in cell wall biosynthesis
MAFENSDVCITATEWQRSLFPSKIQNDLIVIHEGVDTAKVAPDPNARFILSDGRVLTRKNKIVTYCARNLEPYRGFHMFMRALPLIQRQCPNVHTIIVGGDGVSYGRKPKAHRDWKSAALSELRNEIDLSRIVFTGKLRYEKYLDVLQVSSVHVYLTYPFVPSWSLFEAMSSGCPIVASDVASIRNAKNKISDALVLVQFDDPVELSHSVCKFLDNCSETERYSKLSREFICSELNFLSTTAAYQNLLSN